MEEAFQDTAAQDIPEVHAALKERVKFDLVSRAVEYLQNCPDGCADAELAGAEAGLAQVWHEVLQEHVANAGVRR
jgi:hypothetical protein